MPLEPTKHVNGRMWQPGPSGNPNGRPSRLSDCPNFQARPRSASLTPSFSEVARRHGLISIPCLASSLSSLQWTGWVVGRRVLLRASAACYYGPGSWHRDT